MSSRSYYPFLSIYGGTINVLKMLQADFFSFQNFLYGLNNLVNSRSSQYTVHLRNFHLNFFLIALGKTARNHKGFHLPRFFQFCHFQNGIYAFLLGIMDKTAGIYYNDLCLSLIIRKGKAFPSQHSQHHFRIHQIFIAA